ncbi:MAG: DUF167 domain-containing protein [Candidatus Binataceae bacterium]
MRIAATPGTGRRQIVTLTPQGLVVALNAPPEKRKANDEVIDFIARAARVSRTAVTIAHGAGSRHKTLRIATGEPAALAAELHDLVPEK